MSDGFLFAACLLALAPPSFYTFADRRRKGWSCPTKKGILLEGNNDEKVGRHGFGCPGRIVGQNCPC